MDNQNFLFKKKSKDFIVEEKLPFKLACRGDALFVYFEKTNANTMDVIKYLCEQFDISRNEFGIAGLKDKDAVARQWISVYKSTLKKIGGEKTFTKVLSEIVKIIKTDWHTKSLNLSDDISNKFYIRLRGQKNFSQIEKDSFSKIVLDILEKGVPNYFGSQRFGVNYRNINMGKELMSGKLHIKDKFEFNFKLQAYSSHLFNKFVDFRAKSGFDLLDGDIVRFGNRYGFYKSNKINIFENQRNEDFFYFPDKVLEQLDYDADSMELTGPFFGYNTLICAQDSITGKIEQDFMQKFEIDEKNFNIYKNKRIFGLRRSLRVSPTEISTHWTSNDLLIGFTLSKSSYASILIDEIFKSL